MTAVVAAMIAMTLLHEAEPDLNSFDLQENIETFIRRGGLHLLAALLHNGAAAPQHPTTAPAAAAAADAATTKELARALGNIAASDLGRECLLHAPPLLCLTSHLSEWLALHAQDHMRLLALRLQMHVTALHAALTPARTLTRVQQSQRGRRRGL
jgi:hypothetical protein